MTTEEIIKSLEICSNNGDCKECSINPHKGNYGYCTSLAIKAALDLINRQKTELQDLREIVFMDRSEAIKNLKAEAVKEFAERLKANMSNIAKMEFGGFTYFCVGYDLIDNLVKEFTEGKADEDK